MQGAHGSIYQHGPPRGAVFPEAEVIYDENQHDLDRCEEDAA